jgi:hypothetical protein
MMKKVLFTVTCLALVSCRHAPPAPPPVTSESLTFPAIGTVATEGIGEPLLVQTTGTSIGAIVIPEDQKIGDFLVRKGKYSVTQQNQEYMRYAGVSILNVISNSEKLGNIILFAKDKDSKIACVSRKICGEIKYTIDRTTQINRAYFQQTLIYSGKIGTKITLGYRESSGDLARPAFNNDVSYDLSESKILGYKGARLEVINATNTEITYKVIADFK